MKVWIILLFLTDNGVSQRTNLQFSTQKQCESQLKLVIKNNNRVEYGYCTEVFDRR